MNCPARTGRTPASFPAWQQAQRIDAVIFDGIGRAGHHGVAQAGYAMEHLDSAPPPARRRKALNVQLLRVQSHRLYEKLMAELIREPDDFRFQNWGSTGADALDQTEYMGARSRFSCTMRLVSRWSTSASTPPGYRAGSPWNRRRAPNPSPADLHLVKIHGPGVDPGACRS